MTNINIASELELQSYWQAIAPYLTINSEQDYDLAVERLNYLIDLVRDNEAHPLYGLLDTLGILIEAYDREHYQIEDSPPLEILAFLMNEHNLSQGDLPEIGSQGVVSEIFSGKRELNLRHIKALAKRFNVSPLTFI